MADFSPFPELTFEELETLQNLDPEQELLSSGFENELEAFPYGVSPRIDFALGDLAISDGGFIPLIDGRPTLAQWVMQTCLTEKYESPLVSGAIGLEITGLIGEIITNSTLVRVAGQIPPALKAHDRIDRVYVQRVFSIQNDIYVAVRYETDEDDDSSVLLRIAG